MVLRAIPALSVAAPFVIFGLLYALAILPARHAASSAHDNAQAASVRLVRARADVRNAPLNAVAPLTAVVTSRTFAVRTPRELAEAIRSVADSPSLDGVERLRVDVNDSTVTVSFDARYAQMDEFFTSLDAVTGPYDVRSVDMAPASTGPAMLVRATVVLQVRGVARESFSPAPPKNDRKETAVPVFPDPVVQSILFSSQQRSALVDGRIVRAGDRVGTSTVQSIEADGVVLVTDDGRVNRVGMEEPAAKATKR